MTRLLLAAALGLSIAPDGIPLRSQLPTYELSLPIGYRPVLGESPARYVRSRGREPWAQVSVVITHGSTPLTQHPSGVKAADIFPYVPFPPDATSRFAPMMWKDFEVGSFEYRAVVKELPVIGLAVVLPLVNGYLTLMVYAPDPLEKECREEFASLLPRITLAPTNWHSPEHFQKIETLTRVGMAGVALLALYPIVWIIAFRGFPMRAHWLRTAWMVVAAVLLFVPINSPGEMTLICNLLVNALLPGLLLLFAARRIKMAVDE
jgi:hypothetical protein